MSGVKDDLMIMNIDDSQELTKHHVTAQYKKLAKQRHPDKNGGTKEAFQELQNAYKRIIKFIEDREQNDEDIIEDYETEFFKRHNIMKECTSSFVVYIQNDYVDRWRKVLEKHLKVHKTDKYRVILKTGIFTITLYEKPKKDPRS